MATHSSILAWEIPWTEELGGLQSMESHRVGHDLATKQHAGAAKHRQTEDRASSSLYITRGLILYIRSGVTLHRGEIGGILHWGTVSAMKCLQISMPEGQHCLY